MEIFYEIPFLQENYVNSTVKQARKKSKFTVRTEPRVRKYILKSRQQPRQRWKIAEMISSMFKCFRKSRQMNYSACFKVMKSIKIHLMKITHLIIELSAWTTSNKIQFKFKILFRLTYFKIYNKYETTFSNGMYTFLGYKFTQVQKLFRQQIFQPFGLRAPKPKPDRTNDTSSASDNVQQSRQAEHPSQVLKTARQKNERPIVPASNSDSRVARDNYFS